MQSSINKSTPQPTATRPSQLKRKPFFLFRGVEKNMMLWNDNVKNKE